MIQINGLPKFHLFAVQQEEHDQERLDVDKDDQPKSLIANSTNELKNQFYNSIPLMELANGGICRERSKRARIKELEIPP